jgi:hypothetical protein
MIDLIKKLQVIAARANESDASAIQAAITRIQELETRLSDYEEDITDWQMSVEQQMSRKKDNT